MNITAVSMISNIQPVNKRHNNVRFTGNQQSQQDSFSPSRSSSAKAIEANVNDTIREADEVLAKPASTNQDRRQAVNQLAEIVFNSAKEGDSEAVKPVITNLISLIYESKQRSVPPSTDRLVKNTANIALELTSPEMAERIVEILNEISKNSKNLQAQLRSILALGEIGTEASKSKNPEIAKITERIVEILNEISKNSKNLQAQSTSTHCLGEIGTEALKSKNPEIAKITERIVEILNEIPKNSKDSGDQLRRIYGLRDLANRALKLNETKIAERIVEIYEISKNSQDPDLQSEIASLLDNIGTVASKYGNTEVADVIVKNLTKTLKNSDDTQVHKKCIQALINIGKNALEIKNNSSTVPNIATNNDKIARLVISQLFKIATSPKLDQNKEPLILSNVNEALSSLEEEAESLNDKNTTEYINNWKRATKDLEDLIEEVEIIKDSRKEKETIRIKCKEKVREFDEAFNILSGLNKKKKLSEEDKVFIKNLYIDLASTREKLEKIYKKKLETEPEYISQRYRDFLNYLRNRESSEILIAIGSKYNDPCFHPLKSEKGNQTLTQDIVALIPEFDNPKEDGSSRARSILGNVSKCFIEEAKKIK